MFICILILYFVHDIFVINIISLDIEDLYPIHLSLVTIICKKLVYYSSSVSNLMI